MKKLPGILRDYIHRKAQIRTPARRFPAICAFTAQVKRGT
jgi:hypothetical protein